MPVHLQNLFATALIAIVLSDIVRHAFNTTSLSLQEKLQACPTETDRIIKCMNKNPEYFLGK